MTAKREFLESELREAVEGSKNWADVMEKLGYRRQKDAARVRSEVCQLGIDTSGLTRSYGSNKPLAPLSDQFPEIRSDVRGLGAVGVPLATAWFSSRGYPVSIPVSENSPYDLLIDSPSQGICKVQVKTSTSTLSSGAFAVKLRRSVYENGVYVLRPYSVEEVDYFFAVTADLSMYLIPYAVVTDKFTVALGAKYQNFRVTFATA